MEYRKIDLSRFRGLYQRGDRTQTPRAYNWKLENMEFEGDSLVGRKGFSKVFSSILPERGILRAFQFVRPEGIANSIVYLSDEYDSSGNPAGKFYNHLSQTNPILTIPGATDFSALSFYGRLYITPHNLQEGKSGSFVYVWTGSGSARKAAGSAPTLSFNVTETATTGRVSAGVRIFALVYQTDSGYLTKPGPATFPALKATGGYTLRVSGIRSGPAHTTKRYIIATKTIFEGQVSGGGFVGNQENYPFYFVPGGEISNNTDNATVDLNFYDEELLEDAHYLFTQQEELGAGLGLCSYNGRMCLWGRDGEPNILRISKRNEPESFSTLDGFSVVDPQSSLSIRNCWAFRDSLYVARPNKTYILSDNGGAPSTWTVGTVDLGIGTEVNGVATILDTRATNLDYTLIATKQGLILFNGNYNAPEISWPVEELWDKIKDFEGVQITHNPAIKKIYINGQIGADILNGVITTLPKTADVNSLTGFSVSTQGNFVSFTYPYSAAMQNYLASAYTFGDLFSVYRSGVTYYYKLAGEPTQSGGTRSVLLQYIGSGTEPLVAAATGTYFNLQTARRRGRRVLVCDYDLGFDKVRWSFQKYDADVLGTFVFDDDLYLYGRNGFLRVGASNFDNGIAITKIFGLGPLNPDEQMEQHGRVHLSGEGSGTMDMSLHDGLVDDLVTQQINLDGNNWEFIDYGIRLKGVYEFRTTSTDFKLSGIRFELKKAWDRLYV